MTIYASSGVETGSITLTESITASSFGSVGDYSALLGQIRVGADQYGNTIKVVNDANLNIAANNGIYFNLGSAVNGTTTGSNVAYFNINGLVFPSGKGIDFSANANSSGMTSEVLSDYEEGNWGPYWSDVNGNNLFANNSLTVYHARYAKINNTVYYTTYFQSDPSFSYNTAAGVGASTTAYVGGLPFAANGYHSASIGYIANWAGWGAGYTPHAITESGQGRLRLNYVNTGNMINITASTLLQANSSIIISGHYITA